MHMYVMIKGWSSKVTEMAEQTNYSVTLSRPLGFPHCKDAFLFFSLGILFSLALASVRDITVGILLLVAQGHWAVVNDLNFQRRGIM